MKESMHFRAQIHTYIHTYKQTNKIKNGGKRHNTDPTLHRTLQTPVFFAIYICENTVLVFEAAINLMESINSLRYSREKID